MLEFDVAFGFAEFDVDRWAVDCRDLDAPLTGIFGLKLSKSGGLCPALLCSNLLHD